MSTLNINRTNTQSDKSNNINPMLHQKEDYRGIGWLVVMIAASLVVIWLVILFVAWLISRNTYDSHLVMNVFIGGLIFFGIIIGTGIAYAYPILQQYVKNMAYRYFNGVLMHRDDIRRLSDQLIAVAIENAKSVATTGAETYSPSIHTTTNKTDNNNMTQDEKDASLLAGLIDLGDVSNSLDTINKR